MTYLNEPVAFISYVSFTDYLKFKYDTEIGLISLLSGCICLTSAGGGAHTLIFRPFTQYVFQCRGSGQFSGYTSAAIVGVLYPSLPFLLPLPVLWQPSVICPPGCTSSIEQVDCWFSHKVPASNICWVNGCSPASLVAPAGTAGILSPKG